MVLFFTLVSVFAVLDVAWAGLVRDSPSPQRPSCVPEILHERIRRQVLNSSTTPVKTTTLTSGIVSVALASDKQTFYSVISAGNISFRVALDTASSDLWVLSSACTSPSCKSPPKYPLYYDSPSFVPVNGNATTFNVSFADTTTASGFVALETVQLADLSVPNQAFGLMQSSNVSFVDEISGILGLGFPRLSTINSLAINATPFFAHLAQKGELDYPLFGVSLTRNATPGSLSFGAVDSSIIQNASDIEWNEVVPFEPFGSESNSSSYLQWAVHISNITVGTENFSPEPTYPQANSNHSIALIDIGTSGIFGPYQDVERIFSAIDGSRLVDETGQWAIPCDTNLTMTFTFSEQNFTLLPSDYLIGPTSAIPALCLSWPKATPPSSDGIDWQMGAAFLRTVYTIFSFGIAHKEPPMIGFYSLQTNSTPLDTSDLDAVFSSLSLTVATSLPNYILPTPTFSIPSYAFNTSVPTSVIVETDLATSTYAPLFSNVNNGGGPDGQRFNFSALPQVAPTPTLATLILTDQSGSLYTTTSVAPSTSIVLGEPPGYTSAGIETAARRVFGRMFVVTIGAMTVLTPWF
ncbi:acid protease [Artomyces pyxidatus]|uniref:Acid protease n=1 Tax=Artomyces pyxidatus TaxID=48021 RepID=A0ACB8TGC8_9AGAM|nr:acid protease [Artomyces pyxidatus]